MVKVLAPWLRAVMALALGTIPSVLNSKGKSTKITPVSTEDGLRFTTSYPPVFLSRRVQDKDTLKRLILLHLVSLQYLLLRIRFEDLLHSDGFDSQKR